MNTKGYAITTCDDAIHCPKPWTLVDSGYVMHEIGMVQIADNRVTVGRKTLSAKCRWRITNM